MCVCAQVGIPHDYIHNAINNDITWDILNLSPHVQVCVCVCVCACACACVCVCTVANL